MPTIENINIKIPAEFMSSLWNTHAKSVIPSINISYSFDGVHTEVFMITATTTRHRHIQWNDKLYAWINKQATEHAIANYKKERNNARELSNEQMTEYFGMTAVQIAELHHQKMQHDAEKN